MNVPLSRRCFALACLLVTVPFSGCAKPGPPTAPVSGSVTVDGVALSAGQVTFNPVAGTPAAGTSNFSGGAIDASGKYTVRTGTETGAPLGKYKVTVTPSMVPVSGRAPAATFNRRFQEVKTTTLEVEVVPSPAAGAYDLKLTKK